MISRQESISSQESSHSFRAHEGALIHPRPGLFIRQRSNVEVYGK